MKQSTDEFTDVRRSAGFDPLDKTAMKDAWDELNCYLPKAQQKAGLEAFQVEIAAKALSPEKQMEKYPSSCRRATIPMKIAVAER